MASSVASDRALMQLLEWRLDALTAPPPALKLPPVSFSSPEAYISAFASLWTEESQEGFRRSKDDAKHPPTECVSAAVADVFGAPLRRVSLALTPSAEGGSGFRGPAPFERSIALIAAPTSALAPTQASLIGLVVSVAALDRSGFGSFDVLVLRHRWEALISSHPSALASRVAQAVAHAPSSAAGGKGGGAATATSASSAKRPSMAISSAAGTAVPSRPMSWSVWNLGASVTALREGEALFAIRSLHPLLVQNQMVRDIARRDALRYRRHRSSKEIRKGTWTGT